MSFCPMRMTMVRTREIDFSGSTILDVRPVAGALTFSLYDAEVSDDKDKVSVDWGDGSVNTYVPGSNRKVVLTHSYQSAGTYSVRIQNNLKKLVYSHATPTTNSTSIFTDSGEFYSGSARLFGISSVGSAVQNKTLAYGMFANTNIEAVPAGYSAPLITSVNATARMIPFGCFYNCQRLNSLSGLDVTNVRAIDAFSFFQCTALTNVDAFSSCHLYHAGYRSFYHCTSLQNLNGFANSTFVDGDATNLFAGALYYEIDGYDRSKRTYTNHTTIIAELDPDSRLSSSSARYWRAQHFMMCLGKDAFNGCTALTTIASLNCTGVLVPGVFSGCSSLVTVPNGLSNRQGASYYQNTWSAGGACWAFLEYKTYGETGPYSHPSIRYSANSYSPGTGWDWTSGGVFDGCPATNIVDTRFPVIVDGQYNNCTGLTAITITANPLYNMTIGTAFSGCTNLMSVTFTNQTKSQVQGAGSPAMNGYGCRNSRYPFGLPSGCVIHCTDGDLTVT